MKDKPSCGFNFGRWHAFIFFVLFIKDSTKEELGGRGGEERNGTRIEKGELLVEKCQCVNRSV